MYINGVGYVKRDMANIVEDGIVQKIFNNIKSYDCIYNKKEINLEELKFEPVQCKGNNSNTIISEKHVIKEIIPPKQEQQKSKENIIKLYNKLFEIDLCNEYMCLPLLIYNNGSEYIYVYNRLEPIKNKFDFFYSKQYIIMHLIDTLHENNVFGFDMNEGNFMLKNENICMIDFDECLTYDTVPDIVTDTFPYSYNLIKLYNENSTIDKIKINDKISYYIMMMKCLNLPIDFSNENEIKSYNLCVDDILNIENKDKLEKCSNLFDIFNSSILKLIQLDGHNIKKNLICQIYKNHISEYKKTSELTNIENIEIPKEKIKTFNIELEDTLKYIKSFVNVVFKETENKTEDFINLYDLIIKNINNIDIQTSLDSILNNIQKLFGPIKNLIDSMNENKPHLLFIFKQITKMFVINQHNVINVYNPLVQSIQIIKQRIENINNDFEKYNLFFTNNKDKINKIQDVLKKIKNLLIKYNKTTNKKIYKEYCEEKKEQDEDDIVLRF